VLIIINPGHVIQPWFGEEEDASWPHGTTEVVALFVVGEIRLDRIRRLG
jgi:hypothetical protein